MTPKNPKKHTKRPLKRPQMSRPSGGHKDAGKLGKKASMAEAAAVTGLPLSLIQELKAVVCDQAGRVDCDRLLELVATNQELLTKHQAIPDIKLEKALDLRASRMLKEQRHQERAKQLWPIESIKRAWAEQIIACKTKLYNSETEIIAAAKLKLGLPSDQLVALKEIIMRFNRNAIKELFAGEWGKAKCEHCGKEIGQ